jgi:hypothetical protein
MLVTGLKKVNGRKYDDEDDDYNDDDDDIIYIF